MSFNSTIPNRGDFLALSQKQVLGNFTAINNAFLVNHVALTAVENVGMHTSLTFRPQVADPTTTPFQSALYNKLVTSVPQLFWRPNSNQSAIQLTNSNLNTIQTGASGDTQSSFIAGPFTIYLGIVRNCGPFTSITVSPSSNLIYVGLSTILSNTAKPGSNNNAQAINITGDTFTINYNSGNIAFVPFPTIYYMAIGK